VSGVLTESKIITPRRLEKYDRQQNWSIALHFYSSRPIIFDETTAIILQYNVDKSVKSAFRF